MIALSIRNAARASALASLTAFGIAVAAQTTKPTALAVGPTTAARVDSAYGKLPLTFEPNHGQTDPRVQFLARAPQATVFLAGSDAVLKTARLNKDDHGVTRTVDNASVRMHLVGAANAPAASPEQKLSGTVNYLEGNDRSKWHTDLPTYSGVRLSSVYPGVDLRYYGHSGQLEYDFIVAPNADPSTVKLRFEGAKANVAGNGDLELPNGSSTLRFAKPVAYQVVSGTRVNVEAAFAMNANREVTFKLGAYDHSRELTVDPVLIYLGTIGTGINQVDVSQITVDSTGSMYFIGTTNDSTYPATPGSFQTVCGPANATAANAGVVYCNGSNNTSAFVTKLSPDGTQLVYSTYLSGHGGVERGVSIAIDAAGVAYLLGTTGSDDFPVTADAYQKNCVAYYGVFGGPNDVKCDGNYNGGGTEYTIGNQPAFFAKLSADGTSLLYSSFLGGTQPVYPNTIALDASGNMYLSGQVIAFDAATLAPCANGYNQGCQPQIQFDGITSSGYLTISSATNSNGNSTSINATAFLSKFSNDGHTLLYGTFFGDNTSAIDVLPTTMTVGANGVAFLGGYTQAVNYPTTANAIKSACTQPGSNGECNTYDGYVAAIDTTKSGTASLVYSTRLGGTTPTQGSNTAEQEVLGMTADSSNDLFVTGYTFDHTFQMATGGYQATCPNYNPNDTIDRCDSAFLLKINPTGTAILSGTFLGGPDPRSAESVGFNVRVDSRGQVYLYGRSNDGGGDFPQLNPLQAYQGGNQLFISAFSTDFSKLLFSTRFGNPSLDSSSVKPAGGMVLDASDNIYFAGTTNDTTFTTTTGTYSTAAATGAGDHTFFAKLSKVLQPDTVTLTLTPSQVGQGNALTYKAVVAGLYQATPIPTGTVTFTYTSSANVASTVATATLDSTGTATYSGTAPSAGAYTVTASYGADTVYDYGTSAAPLTVNNTAATTTMLTATPAAAKIGATVTLTATISGTGGTPTGSVTFLDGTTTLGTATLAGGVATYTTTSLTVASHSLTARYSGDGTFSGSTSTPQTVAVSLNTVTVGLTATPGVSPVGGTVTLSATLAGATSSTAPTGQVTFYNGTTVVGTASVASSAATVTTTMLPAGSNSITAMYSGDSLYSVATSSPQTVVVRAPAASSTMLSSSSPSASAGSSITFTATITSAVTTGTPSGTVTFVDGSTTLGTGTVSNGTATYTTTSLAVGTHSITATYGGDALFLSSTSTAFSQTVVPATIALTTPNTSLTVSRGQSVTAVITATPNGSYTGVLSFACGSLPTYASCSFAPGSLTFSGSSAVQTTTLTFSTASATSAFLHREDFGSRMTEVLAASLFLPIGVLGFVSRRRKAGLKTLGLVSIVAVALVGMAGLTGCAGSSKPTTAAGTYAVPVTATVNGSTTTLNLSITVQ